MLLLRPLYESERSWAGSGQLCLTYSLPLLRMMTYTNRRWPDVKAERRQTRHITWRTHSEPHTHPSKGAVRPLPRSDTDDTRRSSRHEVRIACGASGELREASDLQPGGGSTPRRRRRVAPRTGISFRQLQGAPSSTREASCVWGRRRVRERHRL